MSTDRVVLLLPGFGYSTERPLLHFTGAVFEAHGWTVRDVSWPGGLPPRDDADLSGWTARLRSAALTHVRELLDRETAPVIALAGKSMGTLTAALAADRNIPAVWLTPLLHDTTLPDDLRRATAPFLLAGGTADRSWNSAAAHALTRAVFEAEGADHGLEIPGNPIASAEVLLELTATLDDFVRAL